jgi:hypothetical protein
MRSAPQHAAASLRESGWERTASIMHLLLNEPQRTLREWPHRLMCTVRRSRNDRDLEEEFQADILAFQSGRTACCAAEVLRKLVGQPLWCGSDASRSRSTHTRAPHIHALGEIARVHGQRPQHVRERRHSRSAFRYGARVLKRDTVRDVETTA